MATELKLTTRYRNGDRSRPAVVAKNEALRVYRRDLADAMFPSAARARLLERVRSGMRLSEAARRERVNVVLVHGRARWDPEFKKLLDDALEEYSAPFKREGRCGTPAGYRAGCRCRQCRTAHRVETTQYR